MTGLIWISKGDIIGCEPLAQKLGGFPGDANSLKQFKEVIELIENNRDGIKFTEEDAESQKRSYKAEGITSMVQYG